MADEGDRAKEKASMSGKLESEIKGMFAKSPSGGGDDESVVNVELARPLSDKLLSMQDTLELFGDTNYRYNASGHLRSTTDGSGFEFENQKQYDQVGSGMEKFVQLAMTEDYDLQEVWLPLKDDGSEAAAPLRNNIFMSRDALTAETLAVVIQGSGAVRAGQWARSVCINDSLASGTIFPYLSRIEDRKWGVIVLNPNMTSIPDPSGALEEVKDDDKEESGDEAKPKKKPSVKRIHIPGSESAQKHTRYVYDHFVSKAKAKDVVIIAHSFGGVCVKELVDQREDILEKLRAIAFTDSVHTKLSEVVADAFKRLARNWIASSEPLDTVESFDKGCWRVSSGHTKHVYTSATAMESVFKYLDDALSGGLGSNNPNNSVVEEPEREQ